MKSATLLVLLFIVKQEIVKGNACCTAEQFLCDNGKCIDGEKVCDGKFNCAGGEDEDQDCAVNCPKMMFQCNARHCINGKKLCDGIKDCSNGRDEVRSICRGVQDSSMTNSLESHESDDSYGSRKSPESRDYKDQCPSPSINCDDFHWCYEDTNGPECWRVCFDICRLGREQSPINIKTSSTFPRNFPPLTLIGFKNEHDMVLTNNGHTAMVNLKPNTYFMSGMGLVGTYVAAQLHFHWGPSPEVGSEHTIDGEAAPLELHIVTHSTDYPDLLSAVGQEGGLAVFGVLFRLSEKDNKRLKPITSRLSSIRRVGDEATLFDLTLRGFLPSDTDKFYRYSGSLTTPGCFEGVIWTVFTDTFRVSRSQLKAFSSSLRSETHRLVQNYRPTQPLNGRIVYRSD